MKAVFSSWARCSIPIQATGGWTTCRHNWISWSLAVLEASKNYSCILFADEESIHVLVDLLKLPFSEVRKFQVNYSKDFWMAGKLMAYFEMNEPFIHLDSDLYLTKKIDDRYFQTGVLVQNAESPFFWVEDKTWFKRVYDDGLEQMKSTGMKIPSWLNSEDRMAWCMGIFGGTDLDFIRKYARTILEILDSDPTPFSDGDLTKQNANPVFEQMGLFCFARKQNKLIQPLFYHDEDRIRGRKPFDLGFVHVMGGKLQAAKSRKIELALKKKYPQAMERVDAIC